MSKIFHLEAPRKKHEENSIRGTHEAKATGCDEIDIDMCADVRGNVYGNHWPQLMLHDGFRDPLGRTAKTKRIETMTPWQVRRLVARTGRHLYRVQRIERLIRECARLRIGIILEPKGDPIFDDVEVWHHLRAVVDGCGATARVYALPQNASALEPARRAGFHATEIN